MTLTNKPKPVYTTISFIGLIVSIVTTFSNLNELHTEQGQATIAMMGVIFLSCLVGTFYRRITEIDPIT
jgi:uncharacterized membrane protein